MTEPANVANVEIAVTEFLRAAMPDDGEITDVQLHGLICQFIHERQNNQADQLRVIAMEQGLMPAVVNIALMRVGLVEFDHDELVRLNNEAARQIAQLQERFRQQFGDPGE